MPSTCFSLRTGHGTRLVASPREGRGCVGVAARAESPDSAGVILCIAWENRHAGWLLVPGLPTIEIEGDENPGPAIPVKLDRAGVAEQVRVLHSLHRWCNLGLHGDPQKAEGELSFSHKGPHREQQFWLDPIEPPPDVAAAAAELGGALLTPPRWRHVLACLLDGSLRGALADAALRALPADELEGLGRQLPIHADYRHILQAAMPANRWFTDRLPALAAWRAARDAAPLPGALLGPAETEDMPGTDGKPTAKRTLGLVLSGFARLATPPRRMACVLATARDEGAYLLEWIAYYLAIGFEHFFITTNDNADGSDDLLGRLAEAGVITWCRQDVPPHALPQHRAYGYALSVMPEILDYRWTLVADIDEYLGFDVSAFSSVIDYINWQEQRYAEAIALPWLLHIARPSDVWSDAPSIERFLLRDAAVNVYVKMLFRTNLACNANPHCPEPVFTRGINFKSETGEGYQSQGTPAQALRPTAEKAWMAHYMFRSAPEMVMKLARGRSDRPIAEQGIAVDNRIRTFLGQLQTTRLVEDGRTAQSGRDQREFLAQLCRLPGVAACDAALKRDYAVKMRDACDRFVGTVGAGAPEHMKALRTLLLAGAALRRGVGGNRWAEAHPTAGGIG